MKYDYSKKSWNIDTGELKSNHFLKKKTARYIIVVIIILLILSLIKIFSGHDAHKQAQPSKLTAAKIAHAKQIARAKQKSKLEAQYRTIHLTIPTQGHS